VQPGKVTVNVTFASDEANGVGGRSTVRTAGLDGLMQAFKTCTDAIIDNLALIQRDDGKLLDGTVQTHTLSSDVLALLASTSWTVRGAWVGGTAYSKGDVVLQNAIVYVCMVAHTANVFAADLAAGDWGALTNTQPPRRLHSHRLRPSLRRLCRRRSSSSTTSFGRASPSLTATSSTGYNNERTTDPDQHRPRRSDQDPERRRNRSEEPRRRGPGRRNAHQGAAHHERRHGGAGAADLQDDRRRRLPAR
jgi:hypothetical protein